MNNARLRIASLLASAPIVLATSGAFAQDAQPPAPAPTGTPGAPPAVAPATTAPAQPATTTEHHDDDHYEGRLRIGFNINGGFGTAGNLSGPTLGGTFRVGWQIDALMGAYYQISPMVWVGTYSGLPAGISSSASAIAGVQNSFMFSLTPADIIEVAAGPSADYLGAASAGVGTASASAGMYLGIHGRVALHLGGRNPQTQRRRGFTLGGDVHPTFTSGEVSTFFTIGLGADWY